VSAKLRERAPLVGVTDGDSDAPAENGAALEGEVASARSRSFVFAATLLDWSEELNFRRVSLEEFMEERGL
jgi:hypothetical protein